MDAFNSCSWCGRVEGEAKSCEEAGSCFWCELLLEGVISWGWGGGVWVRYQFGGGDVGCKGMGGEKDQLWVVDDKVNGGGLGEKEVWSMSGVRGKGMDLVRGLLGYGEVRERGHRKGLLGRRMLEMWMTGCEGEKEDPLVVVEDERNGGGFGKRKGKINVGMM